MNKRLRFNTFWAVVLSIVLQSTETKAQSYGCAFMSSIMNEFKQRGEHFEIYTSLVDTRIKSGHYESNSRNLREFETKIKDSLMKQWNYTSLFDDSLFHVDGEILLIDTFNFFSPYCVINNDYHITVINRNVDLKLCPNGKPNVITVQAIRVYKNHFIITLRYSKSREIRDFTKTPQAVDVKFELIANFPPILVDVERWYLE